MEREEQVEHAVLHAETLGWLEAAAENGGGWASGLIQREKGGYTEAYKTWVPGDLNGAWAAVAQFMSRLLGHGQGASRVQISRALWGIEPERGKVGRWAENRPLIPAAGGILRADLDVAEGEHSDQGTRFPTVTEALSAVAHFQRVFAWGPSLHVYNSGGGLTVVTRHADAEALIPRWVQAWKTLAEHGGWYLDEAGCRGHGGVRVAGSQREGVRIDGEETTLIMGPRPVSVIDRGPMAVHEVWRLIPEGGVNLDHRLPELPEPVREQGEAGEYGEGEGDRPGDRMATAVPASEFVEAVYGWTREGERLRQPGSTGADTWIGDGDVEKVYPHSPSDAGVLRVDVGSSSDSFGLLGAMFDGDFTLASRVARHFDGKWSDLVQWVIDHEGDLVAAAQKLVKRPRAVPLAVVVARFNAATTVAELGGDPAVFATPSAFIMWLEGGNPRQARARMEGLLR